MTRRTYAKGTVVPVAKSRTEIEALLKRYGAQQFISAWDTTDEKAAVAVIGFAVLAEDGKPRQVRMRLPLPNPDDFSTQKQVDAEDRRRWRALALVIKAKLEAVASGISTIEREFLADVVLPDGSTVGDWSHKQLGSAYSSGKMPNLLPGKKRR